MKHLNRGDLIIIRLSDKTRWFISVYVDVKKGKYGNYSSDNIYYIVLATSEIRNMKVPKSGYEYVYKITEDNLSKELLIKYRKLLRIL